MDTKKRIAQLDDEHLAFRRKASELEWDYHDMKREARNFSEEMSNWVISFCRHSSPADSSYILHQIEENREDLERKIRRYEDRLNEACQEENRLYNKKLNELKKETKQT
jgi:hypothetical protein